MTSVTLGYVLLALPALLGLYAYLAYPALLRLLVARRGPRPVAPPPAGWEWPRVSITVPAYNEEAQIRGVVESLLALDYPPERRQILVVSDASTDRTDEIVREYADRGVELLRMPTRCGKTAAENAARRRLTGEVVINTDASIRIAPDALRPLVRCFADPGIGVASGRDVSVARPGGDANAGEAGYVGYEMRIRALETQLEGIVGASGCFYGIRARLHGTPLPGALSRDFAAALIAREHGYRAVSVDEAVCYVPRTASLQREYQRKVRTITRGIQTLWFKRHLLGPRRHGWFAWMLLSHKVCRWLIPWALAAALAGLFLLAPRQAWAAWAAAAALLGLGSAALAWSLSERVALPRWIALPTFALAGNLAALHAMVRALRGAGNAVWEPTRRDAVVAR